MYISYVIYNNCIAKYIRKFLRKGYLEISICNLVQEAAVCEMFDKTLSDAVTCLERGFMKGGSKLFKQIFTLSSFIKIYVVYQFHVTMLPGRELNHGWYKDKGFSFRSSRQTFIFYQFEKIFHSKTNSID